MKKKHAKYFIPKTMRVVHSLRNMIRSYEEGEVVWETDDTDGFPAAFVATYKLVSIKKVKHETK